MTEPTVDPFDVEYTQIPMWNVKDSRLEEDVLFFYSPTGRIATDIHMDDVPKFINFLTKAHATWKGTQ